jgi:hypothetical protein
MRNPVISQTNERIMFMLGMVNICHTLSSLFDVDRNWII